MNFFLEKILLHNVFNFLYNILHLYEDILWKFSEQREFEVK